MNIKHFIDHKHFYSLVLGLGMIGLSKYVNNQYLVNGQRLIHITNNNPAGVAWNTEISLEMRKYDIGVETPLLMIGAILVIYSGSH